MNVRVLLNYIELGKMIRCKDSLSTYRFSPVTVKMEKHMRRNARFLFFHFGTETTIN